MELKSTIEILQEEQTRIVKIEAIKKSLEIEVKVKKKKIKNPKNLFKIFFFHFRIFLSALKKSKPMPSSEPDAPSPSWSLAFATWNSNWIPRREITPKPSKSWERRNAPSRRSSSSARKIRRTFCCSKNSWTRPTLNSLPTSVNWTTRFAMIESNLSGISSKNLNFQEGFSAQYVTRSRRVQRELEAAEERAEVAESNLNMVRAKHRTFVTTSTVPGGQVYMVSSETVTRRSSVERN